MAEKKTKVKKQTKTDIEHLKEKITKIKKHNETHIHDYKTKRQLLVLEARRKKLEKIKERKNASSNK